MEMTATGADRYKRASAAPKSVPQNAIPLSGITAGSAEWQALTGEMFAGQVLSEREALTVSAIYGCVNLIAGAISGLPVVQNLTTADGPVHFEDEFDTILNMQMCPRWGAPSGWEFLIQNLLLHGDAHARIMRGPAGNVIGLEPLRYNRVTPYVTIDGTRLVYAISPDPVAPAPASVFEVLDQDDVLHIPGFGFDGLRGLSPLRYALRVAGSVASATQRYSAEFFTNNARADFYYKTDADLTDPQFARMKEEIKTLHGQPGQRHKPGILTNGLDVKELTLPFEDIQMLATRQFQVEEIARIYGVPPFMIGHSEKTTSWGSGVEAMGIGFVKYALRQHLTKIEAEINRKIYRRPGRFVEFDTLALERADMKTRFEAFRVGVGRAGEQGFIKPNEVRRELRMPPAPDGNELQKGIPPKGAPDHATGGDAEPKKEA